MQTIAIYHFANEAHYVGKKSQSKLEFLSTLKWRSAPSVHAFILTFLAHLFTRTSAAKNAILQKAP